MQGSVRTLRGHADARPTITRKKEVNLIMRSLSRLLSPERIVWISQDSKQDLLKTLTDHYLRLENTLSPEEALKALMDREALHSTSIGDGLALPHARMSNLEKFSLLLGIHRSGIDFDSFDKKPVHIFGLIFGPSSKNEIYVQLLSRLSRFLRDKKEAILTSSTPESIYELTLEY